MVTQYNCLKRLAVTETVTAVTVTLAMRSTNAAALAAVADQLLVQQQRLLLQKRLQTESGVASAFRFLHGRFFKVRTWSVSITISISVTITLYCNESAVLVHTV